MKTSPTITLYGNCQLEALSKILRNCGCDISYINSYESIAQNAVIHDIDSDVFIYQPNRDYLGTYSTNSLLRSKVSQRAFKVAVPYITVTSFWPLIFNPNNVSNGFNNHFSDYSIKDGRLTGFDKINSEDDIWRFFNEDIFFSLSHRLEADIERLRALEASCTVKVADFIEENYRHRRLFFRDVHPTPTVIIELVRQIAKLTSAFEVTPQGVAYATDLENFPELINGITPISPIEISELTLLYSSSDWSDSNRQQWIPFYADLISGIYQINPIVR